MRSISILVFFLLTSGQIFAQFAGFTVGGGEVAFYQPADLPSKIVSSIGQQPKLMPFGSCIKLPDIRHQIEKSVSSQANADIDDFMKELEEIMTGVPAKNAGKDTIQMNAEWEEKVGAWIEREVPESVRNEIDRTRIYFGLIQSGLFLFEDPEALEIIAPQLQQKELLIEKIRLLREKAHRDALEKFAAAHERLTAEIVGTHRKNQLVKRFARENKQSLSFVDSVNMFLLKAPAFDRWVLFDEQSGQKLASIRRTYKKQASEITRDHSIPIDELHRLRFQDNNAAESLLKELGESYNKSMIELRSRLMREVTQTLNSAEFQHLKEQWFLLNFNFSGSRIFECPESWEIVGEKPSEDFGGIEKRNLDFLDEFETNIGKELAVQQTKLFSESIGETNLQELLNEYNHR